MYCQALSPNPLGLSLTHGPVNITCLMNKRFFWSEIKVWEENLNPEEARGDGEEEQRDKQVFVNTDSYHLKSSDEKRN